jgi:hypothetical protein
MERVLKATVAMALDSGTVKPTSLERVTVDTTVQEKAIAHPTDSQLYLKALQSLVRQAKRAGVALRCVRRGRVWVSEGPVTSRLAMSQSTSLMAWVSP